MRHVTPTVSRYRTSHGIPVPFHLIRSTPRAPALTATLYTACLAQSQGQRPGVLRRLELGYSRHAKSSPFRAVQQSPHIRPGRDI